MKEEAFLKKVALTLELSLNMVEDWLQKIHPDNLAELCQLSTYKVQVHNLLMEVKDMTDSLRAEYSIPAMEEEVAALVQDVKNLAESKQ